MAAEKKQPEGKDRRRNFELRERLDELLDLVRHLSRESSAMSQEELDEARLRIEWLAEEIWGAAVYGSRQGESVTEKEEGGSGRD